MLTPAHFGLPAKYSEWREGQYDAVEEIVSTSERFVTICAPTGFGKSLAYEAAAIMCGKRAVVCTSTKGLQDQLLRDFGEINADLRGQNNYPCIAAPEFNFPSWTRVDAGPCHSGVSCKLKLSGCEYYDRYREAQRARVVSTNYSMWMYDQKRKENDRIMNEEYPVDFLVLDEAHDAPGALSDFVGVTVTKERATRAGVGVWPCDGRGVISEDQGSWMEWGKAAVETLDAKIEMGQAEVKQGRATAKLIREISLWKGQLRIAEKIAGMKGEWVIERGDEWSSETGQKVASVRFDPLWPMHYAESVLFRRIKKVVLVSATVRPKTAGLLGISTSGRGMNTPRSGVLTSSRSEKDSKLPIVEGTHSFREFDSSFPVASRPVIHVPTVQLNWKTSDLGLMRWVGTIDRLIDKRLDKNGIIHTISYDRAKMILLNSRHKSRMLSHDSRTRADVVAEYKRRTRQSSGQILVSPSVDTGYDFPYAECEYQIIAKVPFLDNRGRVMKQRIKADKEYSNYQTAQTLVQMTGRGMRAEDDKCETLIVDDNVVWFVQQNKHHFPKWWLDSYQLGTINPTPLEPLPRERVTTTGQMVEDDDIPF